ncbi:hypothetical protein [Vitreoscilla stercoraria]|uniref:Uncharacterized protein n=1 Tax=Vitreoscilla stercoraria TaxID=61 RepID=A0ABY4ED39_VITST|nr:hypothetical protein [Vitreoscilla stercoraria]UOO91347.1 hypothetical protein LVJ81_06615 [Vitreoscilla stercoraria]
MSFSVIHSPLVAPTRFAPISDYPTLSVVLTCDYSNEKTSFVVVLLKCFSNSTTAAFSLASSTEYYLSNSFKDMYLQAHHLAVSLDIPFINHSSLTFNGENNG